MTTADRPHDTFCRRTRREFLWQAGGGFASLALTTLLDRDGFLASQAVAADGARAFVNPLAPKPPHFAPKAKSVIFLFMYGGPSQVDTFDYKPKLYELDGQTVPVKTKGRGGSKNEGRVVGPKWKFKRYGQSGQWVSDLFPHLATCVDDVAFLKSMTADSPIHGSAMLQMNSGRILSGSPALGSLGELRPGEREREHARLRGDARSDGRPNQRRRRTGRAVTCPPVTKARSCARRGRRSSTSRDPTN